jgi:anti-anti-sigma regulatory factor
VDKSRLDELLSLMKAARQAGSGLVLLYEQDDLTRVIAGEKDAFATLDGVHAALRAALEG